MKNLFVISIKDIQYLAQKKIRRKLTIEEIEQVQKGLEFGLECWEEVASAAIEEIAGNKDSKTKH